MSGSRRRRPPARLGADSALLIPLAGLAWLLQGCAQEAPPSRPPATVYSVDLKGAARVCTVSKSPVLADGKATDAQIVVGNDGGWCAITVAAGDQPYSAGLLTRRPAHGKVYIHTVGYSTRIDYTPERGFAGADSFVVELLPGSPTVHVSVTVNPAGAPVTTGPKA
jgi:hypothetical protein